MSCCWSFGCIYAWRWLHCSYKYIYIMYAILYIIVLIYLIVVVTTAIEDIWWQLENSYIHIYYISMPITIINPLPRNDPVPVSFYIAILQLSSDGCDCSRNDDYWVYQLLGRNIVSKYYSIFQSIFYSYRTKGGSWYQKLI